MPTGQTADDGKALGGQFEAQPLRHPKANVARGARADHRDVLGVLYRLRRLAGETPAQKEIWWRVGDMAQINGIIRVAPAHQPSADTWQFAEFAFDRVEAGEGANVARGRSRDAGLHQFVVTRGENPLGRLEVLEQQA